MDKRRNYAINLIPFIRTSGYKDPAGTENFEENGLQYDKTLNLVDVNVSEAEDLTPEAQQEILDEEY